MNTLKGTHIEFHILQSFPVSCLNRDDVGAPKSAMIGGVSRARVSSQCWKRHVRLALQDLGVKIGVRTKQVAGMLAEACETKGATPEQAKAFGEACAPLLAEDTLYFFSKNEAEAIAEFAAAQAPDLNVHAAASFAHAVSTHRVDNEIEFFTALDDLKSDDETGSAHMGSLEYNSATYYRYINLDLGQLADSLGNTGLADAVSAFIKALYIAVPSARQTTQTGMRPWDYARIYIRRGQGMQASFDEPVRAKGQGFLKPSIEALELQLAKQEKLAGSLFGKAAEFTFGKDDSVSIDDLVNGVAAFVRPYEAQA